MRNQQYGFSTGGPILRDRTFFFVTYEEQKFLIGNQAQSTEPSVSYQQSANQVLQYYGVPENPVSSTLLGTIWPAAALTGAAAPNNYFNPNAESGFSHNGLIKLDHNFNENNRLSFRWFVGQGTQTAPIGSHLSYYYQVAPIHVQNYSLVYNTTFSPRLTNQALIGVSYFNQVFSDANSSFNPVSLGLNTGVTNSNLIGAPLIAITGLRQHGIDAELRPERHHRSPGGRVVLLDWQTPDALRRRNSPGASGLLLQHRRPRRVLFQRNRRPLGSRLRQRRWLAKMHGIFCFQSSGAAGLPERDRSITTC